MSQSVSKEVRDLRILPYQKRREAYSMKGKCSNCGWMGTLLIPMGDKAPGCGFGERKAFCDTCGCREVVAVR